jgi:hypothetical protein
MFCEFVDTGFDCSKVVDKKSVIAMFKTTGKS